MEILSGITRDLDLLPRDKGYYYWVLENIKILPGDYYNITGIS